MSGKPLSPDQTKRRISVILETGSVSFSGHALRELKADGSETTDALNVLRGGWADPAEWEDGEWRYRVHTRTMFVVLALPPEDRLRVVTAWRKR